MGTADQEIVLREFMQYTGYIASVCDPFFRKYPSFNHFAYIRITKDGKLLRLSSDLDWSKNYFDHNFHQNLPFYLNQKNQLIIDGLSNPFCLWQDDIHNKNNEVTALVYDELEKYNIGNGVSLYFQDEEGADSFHFGCLSHAKYMNDFHSKHLDIINSFTLYFKSETLLLQKELTDKGFMLLSDPNHDITDVIKPKYEFEGKPTSIFEPKRLIFSTGRSMFHITKREFEIVYYLSQGKKVKDIARILSLSHRTIQSYISELKYKLEIDSTGLIIDLFIKHNLEKWYKGYRI